MSDTIRDMLSAAASKRRPPAEGSGRTTKRSREDVSAERLAALRDFLRPDAGVFERAPGALVPQRAALEALRRFARERGLKSMGPLLGTPPPKPVAELLAQEGVGVEAGVRCRAVPGGRATTTVVLTGLRFAGEGARLFERLEPREAVAVAEEATSGADALWRAVVPSTRVLKQFMEPFGLEKIASSPLMVQRSDGPEWGGGFTGLFSACKDESDDFRVWSFLRCEVSVDGARPAGAPHASRGGGVRDVAIVWDKASITPPPFLPANGDDESKGGEADPRPRVLRGGEAEAGTGRCLTVPYEVVTAMVRARVKGLESAHTKGPLVVCMQRVRMLSVTPLDAEDAGHSAQDLMQLVRSGRRFKAPPSALKSTDAFMALPQEGVAAACASAATYGASHVYVTVVVERVTDPKSGRSVVQATLNLRSLQTSLGAHQRWFRGDVCGASEWGTRSLAEPIQMEVHASHRAASLEDVRTQLWKSTGLYPTNWLKSAVSLCPKSAGDDGAPGCLLIVRGTDKPLTVVASSPDDGLHHVMYIRPASRPDVIDFSKRSLEGLDAEGGALLPESWQPDITRDRT